MEEAWHRTEVPRGQCFQSSCNEQFNFLIFWL